MSRASLPPINIPGDIFPRILFSFNRFRLSLPFLQPQFLPKTIENTKIRNNPQILFSQWLPTIHFPSDSYFGLTYVSRVIQARIGPVFPKFQGYFHSDIPKFKDAQFSNIPVKILDELDATETERVAIHKLEHDIQLAEYNHLIIEQLPLPKSTKTNLQALYQVTPLLIAKSRLRDQRIKLHSAISVMRQKSSAMRLAKFFGSRMSSMIKTVAKKRAKLLIELEKSPNGLESIELDSVNKDIQVLERLFRIVEGITAQSDKRGILVDSKFQKMLYNTPIGTHSNFHHFRDLSALFSDFHKVLSEYPEIQTQIENDHIQKLINDFLNQDPVSFSSSYSENFNQWFQNAKSSRIAYYSVAYQEFWDGIEAGKYDDWTPLTSTLSMVGSTFGALYQFLYRVGQIFSQSSQSSPQMKDWISNSSDPISEMVDTLTESIKKQKTIDILSAPRKTLLDAAKSTVLQNSQSSLKPYGSKSFKDAVIDTVSNSVVASSNADFFQSVKEQLPLNPKIVNYLETTINDQSHRLTPNQLAMVQKNFVQEFEKSAQKSGGLIESFQFENMALTLSSLSKAAGIPDLGDYFVKLEESTQSTRKRKSLQRREVVSHLMNQSKLDSLYLENEFQVSEPLQDSSQMAMNASLLKSCFVSPVLLGTATFDISNKSSPHL